ncbi:hypothetical protein PYH37_000693 [Sinorhizobium numidicum]|uniref:NYN domain-containing protein n=1 Tax=Sinorhizobium numidicum TaxID=680248 RepID=A0ABY8CRS6_9HYPH|nr:hypothetical protein [Sinorhizobium numidicum]WEX75299.1 hypothetical protein PYH37_000693 [Sinorhizobium numidicum]WEX81294.1 hypothetical protein PYH38_000695 [Sinorhizobium numidicum]
MGDRFAYQVAKEHGCRLLYIGEDFAKTSRALQQQQDELVAASFSHDAKISAAVLSRRSSGKMSQ